MQDYLHLNLLGCTGQLGSFLGFDWACTHGILEVTVNRVVRFPLSLRERKEIELESFALLNRE